MLRGFPHLIQRFAVRSVDMPKVTPPHLPTSAVFGITKPSGPPSMTIINDLKRLVSTSRLFVEADAAKANAERLYATGGNGGNEKGGRKGGWEKGKRRKRGRGKEVEAKIGQGGTLDPLADGVLVVGVNKGTKKLTEFLDCIKEYRTTVLLGCETDTYDSEGTQVRTAPWKHVTKESVEAALAQFRGNIQQTPPVFSALKMDGMPLYEYARSGIPLPRPIERRPVTVHSLELTHWIPGKEHEYVFPEKKFSDEEREKMEKALRGTEIAADAAIKDKPEQGDSVVEEKVDGENEVPVKEDTGAEVDRPPAFVLTMRVSGGTYVRCIAHDVAHAVGSAAHVVTLTRSSQGRFGLAPSALTATPVLQPSQYTATATAPASGEASENTVPAPIGAAMAPMERECVPWEVLARALEDGGAEEPDADGWRKWEYEVMEKMEIVDEKAS